jgi:hypothetical protein
VIRRLFWLVLGAVLGVTAYRRLTAAARALLPVTRARQLTRFAADVRDGMELYLERQPRRAPLTLEGQQARGELPAAGTGRARRIDHAKDGR